MRILYLTQYYDPEPVEKVHDLAAGLVRRGHEVRVVTGIPCYPTSQIYPGYRNRVSHETRDGVCVTRVPQWPDHSHSAWRRARYYSSFLLASLPWAFRDALWADVILVYQAAILTGVGGILVSRMARKPVVLDVVDLWPESLAASGFVQSNALRSVVSRISTWVYFSATHLVAVTEGFRERLVARGVPAARISLIPNWMPATTYSSPGKHTRLRRDRGIEQHAFVVTYAGNMGPAQDLRTVLEAATLLENRANISFNLVGGGLEEESLRSEAARMRLSNVQFLGRRGPEEMPALLESADALLVHLKRDELSVSSIPSKTFSYLASAKPILMAVEGAAAALVERLKCGLAVRPSDPAALAEAILRVAAMTPQERQSMGDAGKTAYETEFSPDSLIDKFESLLARTILGKEC